MTLAHGTDRLESARLVLRRVAPDDLPFFTRLHALSKVAQHLYPNGSPRSPEETAAWLRYTLASYEQLALGYLAVLRKEDGALIGRCGLMDLVVESSAPEHEIRRGWFGREDAPAGLALTFECELGYTFDPTVWAGVSRRKRPAALAATRAMCCGGRTRSRLFCRGTRGRVASPNGRARGQMAKCTWSVRSGIATYGRSRWATGLGSSRYPRNRRDPYRRATNGEKNGRQNTQHHRSERRTREADDVPWADPDNDACGAPGQRDAIGRLSRRYPLRR